MSAQKDCEFLVKRARDLVSEDPCAAKAWLITARTLYPADFTIQVSCTKTYVEWWSYMCTPNHSFLEHRYTLVIYYVNPLSQFVITV